MSLFNYPIDTYYIFQCKSNMHEKYTGRIHSIQTFPEQRVVFVDVYKTDENTRCPQGMLSLPYSYITSIMNMHWELRMGYITTISGIDNALMVIPNEEDRINEASRQTADPVLRYISNKVIIKEIASWL